MRKIFLLFLLSFFPICIFQACGPAVEDLSYKQDEHYPVFLKYCGVCHTPARALAVRFSQQGWRDMVRNMRARDPDLIPPEQVEKIMQFLIRHRSV